MSEKVLEAPCVFCGYNGSHYWQSGTHSLTCPWRNIGGEVNRCAALPRLAVRLAARVAELEGENAKLQKSSDLAASLAEEFERAVASREPVHGMQVTPTGDFIACAQLPSAVRRMAWWAREIRAALDAKGDGEEPKLEVDNG